MYRILMGKYFYIKYLAIVVLLFIFGCDDPKPSKDQKIIEKKSQIDEAVGFQMESLLKNVSDSAKSSIKLYNPHSLQYFLAPDYKTTFTSKFSFTPTAIALKKFIDSNCKYFGLYSSVYHQSKINQLFLSLSSESVDKKNAENWAKAELYMTDALMQIAKHIHKGRLYNDTSYKTKDTAFVNNVFKPLLDNFQNQPAAFEDAISKYEPKFHDYDSLKMFLRKYYDNPESVQKKYTPLVYTSDSALMVKRFLARLEEEGMAIDYAQMNDSARLAEKIKEIQVAKNVKTTAFVTQELVSAMNSQAAINPDLIAFTLDKFKNKVVAIKDHYVLVNIPAFTLRAFNKQGSVLESKVVVGKLASKTPVMESEIAQIITMPKWFVPPSILKIPGYIERKKNNPNYIVRGKTVIQKSGANNALGQMKFNFKSSDAIYLHDTNEKWAFNSKSRAMSHGCVRVQSYEKLAKFINSVTPLLEKDYQKVIDKIKVDSIKKDTSKVYKYIVKDSIVHTNDIISGILSRKAHHELNLQTKMPIYIDYFTCTIRNGQYVQYADVYGQDKKLMEVFLKNAK